MIIKIKKKPDMPVFDSLPEKFSQLFKGLLIQVSTYGYGGNIVVSGATTSRSITNKKPNRCFVDWPNLLAVAYEKSPEFYTALKSILKEQGCEKVGFDFSSTEIKEVTFFF